MNRRLVYRHARYMVFRMRTLTVPALLVTFCVAAAAKPLPTVEQLLKAEAEADLKCRGSTDADGLEEVCARRDRLVGRLTQSGYCFGKTGQREYQKAWHRCDAKSIYFDDLKD